MTSKPDVTYREALSEAVLEMETQMKALFKADYSAHIPYKTYNLRDRTQRQAAVAEVADTYTIAHNEFNAEIQRRYFERGGSGEGPALVPADATLLVRLANIVLYDELTDDHPDKVTRTEYPFFSESQLERRHDKEVSLWVAEAIGTDGRDYRPKKKRMRSKWEHEYVDRNAKIRNKARATQYVRDITTVTTAKYNLADTNGELTESFVDCIGIGARWLEDMSVVNELVIEPAEESAEIYVREVA
ncbi:MULTISPECIES: hypothetical protein [Paenibacillus]|uniref:hypothetical protein n=1 Tax=Paenibacillus TaxID=44249 RepID=UPI00096BE5A2|nr:hypothetical protein [Paenibacillus odorifer]OMC96221.1 hypothetical protein BJP49_10995 [Paenibacillus odorifer]OMD02516.1 hypothetical protein BJP46_15550 [Paenibacillus odorifer]OMD16230.1 hypothetical protein BJP50_18505 [Paenibacillus odorifer]